MGISGLYSVTIPVVPFFIINGNAYVNDIVSFTFPTIKCINDIFRSCHMDAFCRNVKSPLILLSEPQVVHGIRIINLPSGTAL